MKKHFIIFGLLCSLIAKADQSVTLAWNPSPDPTVTGYNIYYGTGSGAYTTKIFVGNTNLCSISGLKVGTQYFFIATAVAGTEESLPSNEISYTVPITTTNTSTNKVESPVLIGL